MTTSSTSIDLPGRIALRLLRWLAGRRQGLPPLPSAGLRRVLLVRYDRLGDMVITTPLVDALGRIAPGVEIDILASNANRALVERDPRIANVWIWSDSLRDRIRVIRACRARGYDAAFQLLFSRTTLPAIFTSILAPRSRTIGKSAIGHDFLFNHAVRVHGEHYAEKTLSLLEGLALEAPLPHIPYSIYIPEDERLHAGEVLAAAGLAGERPIMLNISAGNASRELSDERNAELARRLARHGFPVAIIGAPDAAERASRIASTSGAAPLRFRSLLALIAAMERARLVVTPDTGTLHVAAAAKAPVVGMYPSFGDPTGWGPRDVPFAIVKMTEGGTLEGISIEEVDEGAMRVLRESGGGSPESGGDG